MENKRTRGRPQKEPTKVIRVPVAMVQEFKELIQKRGKENPC